MNNATHYAALDGFRGFAVLAVLAAHLFPASVIGLSPGLVDGPPGSTGVDAFFVLSGFLITGILWRAKENPGYFTTFYKRRVLRIFPLYYLSLAVVILLAPALGLWRDRWLCGGFALAVLVLRVQLRRIYRGGSTPMAVRGLVAGD